jgi:N-acetylglucosamine-6-phosphate deacetylase
MYALTNCDVYTGRGVVTDKSILIEGGMVIALVSPREIEAQTKQVDLGGLSVAPGFIDIQVNGGGGVLFNDVPTPEGIRRIVEGHRKFGTTNLLPTLITTDRGHVSRALDAIRKYGATGGSGGVLGIHFEGPFINPDKAGVHDKKFITSLDEGDLELFSSLGDEGSTLLTLAPEVVPPKTIAALVAKGVKVSAGHTNASWAQIDEATREGLSCITHIFNAMSQFGSREPGTVGAALDAALPSLYAGVIADGHHVSFPSLRVAWQAFQRKNKGRMMLVTDAMPPVGSSLKSFRLGDYDIRLEDGRLTTADGVLAGSALDMASAVRNCVQRVGIPKDEALRMASTYQAEYLGLGDHLGYVAAGYDANLVIFNNEIAVSGVLVNGRLFNKSELWGEAR